jgi:hypothetical protein
MYVARMAIQCRGTLDDEPCWSVALFERMRGRISQALGAAPAVLGCHEAGHDGF